MCVNIETDRLILRPLNVKDTHFIIDLVNSDGWIKFIGNRNISTEKEAGSFIQKILNDDSINYTVFELKKRRKAIGIVTYLERKEEQFPDFGFALLPEFEKKGYAFEASNAYLEKILVKSNYKNIIAITKPNNQKSVNLLKKLGFIHTADKRKKKELLSYYNYQNDT